MVRSHLVRSLLLSLALAGCVGTEVGNPDLVAHPEKLLLELSCPGATHRASVLLENRTSVELDAAVGGTAGEEAYPSVLALRPWESREVVAVIRTPADASRKATGKLQVTHHRRSGSGRGKDETLSVPWSARVDAAPVQRATVLCGEEIDCAGLAFGRVGVGISWALPFEVVNDGCAPLQVERVELEGDASLAGPGLPVTLAPGARWSGQLQILPARTGELRGTVVVTTDDPARREQRIGWHASAVP